jgi:flagellar assembly factor FliW
MTTSETRRKVTTKTGEEVEVPENHIVRIIDGILGFSEYEEYALVPHGEDSPFLWLQSLDQPNLAFLTIDPKIFMPDYKPVIARSELELIELEDLGQAIVQAIIVIPENPSEMTANLLGPIVINAAKRAARQVISQSPHHKIRHFILEQEPREAGGGSR